LVSETEQNRIGNLGQIESSGTNRNSVEPWLGLPMSSVGSNAHPLDIPDEIHAWLKALAKSEGTTMRAIILQGIEAVLRERQAMGSAEPLGTVKRLP
jgi:hypothetical protein